MQRTPVMVAVCLAAIAASASAIYFHLSRNSSAKHSRATDAMAPAQAESIIASMPSITAPATRPAGDAGVAADAEVLGVCINDQCRAYLLDAFHSTPTDHLVNDLVADVPVSVSYCPLSNCARVVTDETPGEPVVLRVGGFGMDGLILLYGNRWYKQDALDLPLRDLPFVRTTWSQWLERHPESDIYVGPNSNSGGLKTSIAHAS